MKRFLMSFVILLSSVECSFSAEAAFSQDDLCFDDRMMEASLVLKACVTLGMIEPNNRKKFFDLIGSLPSVPPLTEHVDLIRLNILSNPGKSEQEKLQLLSRVPIADLTRATILADALKMTDAVQNTLHKALAEELIKCPTDTQETDVAFNGFPTLLLSVIQKITTKLTYNLNAGFSAPITSLSIHPNSILLLAVGSNNCGANLCRLDLKNNNISPLKKLTTDQETFPNQALFSQDGSIIALIDPKSATFLTTQSLLDTPVNDNCPIARCHEKVTGDTSSFTTAVFSAQNAYTLLSDACPMECFNPKGQAVKVRFPDGDNGIVGCMAYSPNHQHNNLVATASPAQSVKLWNLTTGNVIRYFRPGDSPSTLAIHLSSDHLFTQEPDKATRWVLEHQEEEGTVIYQAKPHEVIRFLAVHANGKESRIYLGDPHAKVCYAITPDLSTVASASGKILSITQSAPVAPSIVAALAMVKKAQQ